jgi:uncharacterized protein YndB with AHSA1/START domain
MTDQEEGQTSTGRIIAVEPEKLLSYSWGDELLTWEITPIGTGTELTLRHKTETPENLPSFAAGWHICLAVAERFLDGRPIGRIVGKEALNHGWAELNAAYQAELVAP